MTLGEYIQSLGLTDKAFAEKVGLTSVTISKAKQGNIGRVTAKKLIDFSDGKLDYNSIYKET